MNTVEFGVGILDAQHTTWLGLQVKSRCSLWSRKDQPIFFLNGTFYPRPPLKLQSNQHAECALHPQETTAFKLAPFPLLLRDPGIARQLA